MNGGGRKKAPDQTDQPSVARERRLFLAAQGRKKGARGGRDSLSQIHFCCLVSGGKNLSVMRSLCERERECTYSADDDDDGGSWSFGSVALFVADPIWRFWRFPSETVIMASGWIVGQMSGTASPCSSLRVVCEQRFFSHFCVGWLSIIFGTLHNNGRSNERALTDPPSCPLRLVARQIAPSLVCPSLHRRSGSGSAFFISWVTSVSPEAAARAARRQAPIPSR